MPDIAAYIKQQQDALLKEVQMYRAIKEARKTRKLDSYFLSSGPFRRGLYVKHCRFFECGGQHTPGADCPPGCDGSAHRERLLLAANRTGKTVAAAFELTLHATGQYPEWWQGARFHEPVLIWAVNDTNANVRDINQVTLLGSFGNPGTGMLPADTIIKTTIKPGISDAFTNVQVQHVSGGISTIAFKSYEQGWQAFTGQAVHAIWCDEEPDVKVYTECCIRTMTTDGLILLTFTPLKGTTEVVKGFIEAYVDKG